MESGGIARAMVAALSGHTSEALFEQSAVVFNPGQPEKKREPFYFDARRAPNSHSRDIGFSPNDLGLETTAFPAVEALCLIGLQRFRPSVYEGRLFEYRSWGEPVTALLASVIVNGTLDLPNTRTWRFENWFRTGQRKHKAFRPATLVLQGAEPNV
jgi:CRISPR-associated protein Csb3